MPRGLDHIVHAVADLDHAADIYRALGFAVGAENHHPWGTSNRIVQLPGCFVELLAIARPDQVTAQAPQTFSFGAFNREFLARGEGLSMLALESRNAAADADSFLAAGFGGFDLLRFERAGRKGMQYFECHYHVAYCRFKMGDKTRARQTLRSIKTLHPGVGSPEMKAKYDALLKQIGP